MEGLPLLGIPSIRPARNAVRRGSGGVRSVTSKEVVQRPLLRAAMTAWGDCSSHPQDIKFLLSAAELGQLYCWNLDRGLNLLLCVPRKKCKCQLKSFTVIWGSQYDFSVFRLRKIQGSFV